MINNLEKKMKFYIYKYPWPLLFILILDKNKRT
jgi:hypothetical protein